MRFIPKVSIVISIIAFILDIIYIIVGPGTLGSTGINGSQFLRFGLTFSHMAIALALVCNAYSKIKKIRLEYAGASLVFSIIVFTSPAIIVYISTMFKG